MIHAYRRPRIEKILFWFFLIFCGLAQPAVGLDTRSIEAALRDGPGYPVLLVHGIAAGVDKWDPLLKPIPPSVPCFWMSFRADGVSTNFKTSPPPSSNVRNSIWSVSYYTNDWFDDTFNGNLTLFAKRLNIVIDQVCKLTGAPKVMIVAHSMGGLVARKAMVTPPSGPRVAAILTIGTPHRGLPMDSSIVKQIQDMGMGSVFLRQLDLDWTIQVAQHPIWFGVVAGYNASDSEPTPTPKSNDGYWPGVVQINSAIPDEANEAIQSIGTAQQHTQHYAYRVLVRSEHNRLIEHPETIKAIATMIQNAK